VRFAGAQDAAPAPGVLEAISQAEAVLIAPSNPVTSIGPILSVPGIRQALCKTSAPVVAVSPMIGNAAVSGPAAALMASQGLDASIKGVAAAYGDFLDLLVAHDSDSAFAQVLSSERLQVHCTNILMRTLEDRTRIAQRTLELVSSGVVSVAEAK
jgi:LPPG:FO 2-phospho-L-lactate transferase